jgi:hypothetical protein
MEETMAFPLVEQIPAVAQNDSGPLITPLDHAE